MSKAIFVSPKYVKQKSIISGDLDADKLIQFIETAQDFHIQNYLGTELYNKVMSLIVADTIDDVENAVYRTLLDTHIKPMLAWFTQADFIPYAPYSITNGGVFRHRSENSDSASQEEIARLANLANDKATFYTQRFLEFMCDNSNDYPEYNSTSEDMSPDKTIDSSSWFLG